MDFNRRLDEICWALFLMMIGLLWLVPDKLVPQGTWMLGTAVILLGINAVRYAKGLGVNGFSTTLGILALVAGGFSMAGVHVPILPILLVVVGAMMLLRPLFVKPADVVGHHA